MNASLQKADSKVNLQNSDMQIDFLHNAGMDRHQRLKLARERHFATAKAAAISVGVPYGTYSGHEAGSRGIKDDELNLYARRFKVPVAWLSLGVGSINDEPRSLLTVAGRIGAGALIDMDVAQLDAEPMTVEVALEMPPGVIAFEVTGDSMFPKYEDGDMVVVEEDGIEIEDLPDGAEAAVRTSDGRRYLKKVVRTEQPDLYNLESHNAPVIRGVKLEWVADVIAIIPARKWRKLPNMQRGRLVMKIARKK